MKKNAQKQKDNIKHLGISLIKEVKDLFLENCKTVMKEIENNPNRGKICRAHELEELTVFK